MVTPKLQVRELLRMAKRQKTKLTHGIYESADGRRCVMGMLGKHAGIDVLDTFSTSDKLRRDIIQRLNLPLAKLVDLENGYEGWGSIRNSPTYRVGQRLRKIVRGS